MVFPTGRLKLLLVVACMVIGIGTLFWWVNRPYHVQRHNNEYAIYRSLLMDTDYWGKWLIISATTDPYFERENLSDTHQYGYLVEDYPDLQLETWKDAVLANEGTHLFPSNLPLLLTHYTLVPPSTLRSHGGPIDRYMQFSKVGFNQDFTQAIVYISYTCGVHRGGSDVYFLESLAGQWTLIERQMIQIS